METEVTFVATPTTGGLFVGEVIDLHSQDRKARNATRYTSAETAKSAAASMWRAKLALAMECAA